MNIINSHYIPLKEPYDMLLAPDGRIYTQIGTLAVIEEAKKKKEGYGIVAHHHPVVISALQGVASTTIGEPNDEDDEVEVDYLVSPSNGEVLYQYESKSCHQLCTTDHREVDLSDFNTQILISYLDKTHEHPIDVGASIDYMQACGIHINFPESPDRALRTHPQRPEFECSCAASLVFTIQYLMLSQVGMAGNLSVGHLSPKKRYASAYPERVVKPCSPCTDSFICPDQKQPSA